MKQGDEVRIGLMALAAFVALEAIAWFQDDDVIPGVYPANPINEAPTLSVQQLSAMAAVIAEDFEEFWGGENEKHITETILVCNNDADVATLINLFGEVCYNFGLFNCLTLPGSIAAYFSSGERQVLNEGLAHKGISFTF